MYKAPATDHKHCELIPEWREPCRVPSTSDDLCPNWGVGRCVYICEKNGDEDWVKKVFVSLVENNDDHPNDGIDKNPPTWRKINVCEVLSGDTTGSQNDLTITNNGDGSFTALDGATVIGTWESGGNGAPGPADTAGMDANGVPYAVGDPIVTLSNGDVLVLYTDNTILIAGDAGALAAGDTTDNGVTLEDEQPYILLDNGETWASAGNSYVEFATAPFTTTNGDPFAPPQSEPGIIEDVGALPAGSITTNGVSLVPGQPYIRLDSGETFASLTFTDCAGNTLDNNASVAVCGTRPFVLTENLLAGAPTTINPTSNDLVGEGASTVIVAGSEVGCTVVINPDGTHTVIPDIGATTWTYDYETTSGLETYGGTVSGGAYPFTVTDFTEPTNTVVGEPTTIFPALDDTPCAVGGVTTVVAGSEVGCTVVINGDGSHTVTPTPDACPGGWTYDYETLCGAMSDTGTVSGTLDATPATLALATANETTVNLGLTTDNNSTYDIDWGDGTVDVGLAGDSSLNSHTYATPYTGDITVTTQGCANITDFVSTSGHWTFNLADLPRTLITYQNVGLNVVRGNMADIPPNMTSFISQGRNITSGDIADIPSSVTIYSNTGRNTTTGQISNLHTGIVTFIDAGRNTISGDIAALPDGVVVFNAQGSNTTTGNIGSLPAGLLEYVNRGQNTTSGNVDELPAGLTRYQNVGLNTASGDIGLLPAGVTQFVSTANSTVFGDIAGLPAGLTLFSAGGTNTTSGDIANLPAGLVSYANTGNNTVTAATTTWPMPTTGMVSFINTGAALAQAAVDNMLVAAANATGWTGLATVDVSGDNAAPSAVGAAAADTLAGNGATVIINYSA